MYYVLHIFESISGIMYIAKSIQSIQIELCDVPHFHQQNLYMNLLQSPLIHPVSSLCNHKNNIKDKNMILSNISFLELREDY